MKKNRGKRELEKKETVPILYNSAGLINQTLVQEKPNSYIRKIKTVQFILYNRKGGLDESSPYRRIKFMQG